MTYLPEHLQPLFDEFLALDRAAHAPGWTGAEIAPRNEKFLAFCADVHKLVAERDHWKANHDAQVERSRVLLERTDMPLERVQAHRQIGALQRLVSVQKMLLEAFAGALTPAAGVNPMGDGQCSLEDSIERLREAYVYQQPLPVPDQMALVWRADIGRLRGSWIHLKACFENNVTKPETPELVAIRQAIADYHYALDTRQHGGVAQDHAFNSINSALGTYWRQGAELAKRRADAESGESNQPISAGKTA